MKLLIVESPAKAKKIAHFLGEAWRVEACLGHIRDLPETELGVEVEKGFQPTYEVLPGKGNVVRRLLKAMKDAEAVYLATDPDREGEAIAWHLLELARLPKSKPIYRATFSAITAEAVRSAVEKPRSLDANLVEAQHARRIVDRLVGYLASPLAAKALDGKYSAGRVQSVSLRLVVEREREIEVFTSEPFWTLALKLEADGIPFTAKLVRLKGTELPFKSRDLPDKLIALLRDAVVWVEKAGAKERLRAPLPPFTTSSLQQAAAKGLGLSPERTMTLAQTLYEAGLITYMRTDGVAIAPEAQAAAREFIQRDYGKDYHPPTPPTYAVKAANAQEAHEAIRPTDVHRLPQGVEGDGAALYALIWRRFVASQMQPARYHTAGAVIYAGKKQGQPFPMEFRAQGETLLFDGFLKVYEEPLDEGDEREASAVLPPLQAGQTFTQCTPEVTEGATRAPARYTEAALVQALERHGIGRPSTYAGMVKIIKEKGYVKVEKRRLVPTASGIALCDFLTAHFGDVLAYDYTARLESGLDEIAAGERTRLEVLQTFWHGFQPQLRTATEYALGQVKARHTARPLTLRARDTQAEE